VISWTMKNLVTLLLALPCLAEPDIYSYIWTTDPQILATLRLYQPKYIVPNTLFRAPLVNVITGIRIFPSNSIDGQDGKEMITKVGDLPQRVPEMHPMRGSVYFNANDDSQIIVKGFYYPQAGPDAFFWAGEDEPSCSEQSITGRNYLLAPGKVGSRDYYNKDQPILPPYSGTEGDIVLTLPPGVSARNLKWICVWCRKFAQNFGTLEIKS